jgi:uncharacterized membrane protein
VVEDRVRVLYVENCPRYEYRYLKNALLREPTIELSVLLLDADEQFVQDGTDPIRRFPDTPEELNRYDVLILGDVDPQSGWLSAEQMIMLRDYVGNEGGGVALIAGERYAPRLFRGTPLEKLIPVRIAGDSDEPVETTIGSFSPEITLDGRRTGLFRAPLAELSSTGDGADENVDESEEYMQSLPDLYWFAWTAGTRPGASVLACHPTIRIGQQPAPLIVLGRFGAGKTLFQATDDTWRWRRHTGELFHDTYWLHAVRLLCRDNRLMDRERFVIRTDARKYAYGASVHAQLELLDTSLSIDQDAPVALALTRMSGSGDAAQTVGSSTGAMHATIQLQRVAPESRLFDGSFVPIRPGSYSLSAPSLQDRSDGSSPAASFVVDLPDLEDRKPEADFVAMDRLAESTGGKVIDLDQLETEFATIRDRSVQIPDDVTETLWDSKLVVVLFVVMISVEWVMRKAFGLT